jgi:decaprenylphospho-beta-D-ribofuranose 2-oxidase
VPKVAAHLVPRTFEALRQVGAPSFLTVLKRFGPSNPAPLSFPMPGWTLAADVPAAVPGLLEVLDQLDEEVATAGGRLCLAKDPRQLATISRETYLDIKTDCCQGIPRDSLIPFSSDMASKLLKQFDSLP